MYLQASSPEVARWIDALGGDSSTTVAAMVVARAGDPVTVTLEQTLPSKLVNGTIDLEIPYKLIRKDYAELLDPFIEQITGTKTPSRSELDCALRALRKTLTLD